jgi:hypothetical protein
MPATTDRALRRLSRRLTHVLRVPVSATHTGPEVPSDLLARVGGALEWFAAWPGCRATLAARLRRVEFRDTVAAPGPAADSQLTAGDPLAARGDGGNGGNGGGGEGSSMSLGASLDPASGPAATVTAGDGMWALRFAGDTLTVGVAEAVLAAEAAEGDVERCVVEGPRI